jgi:L-ascorbate metabolism protein UlaG (beta-lactamase superfamily)
MQVTWLTQAGLLFEKNGKTVMIDPYLSNSVVKVNPNNWRRVPVDEALFDVTPDVMIFTHDHLDHYDPETAPRFFAKTDKQMLVLCPASVWQKARTHGNGHNYVQFDAFTEWTAYGMRFSAVRAEHSDAFAIGVIIEDLETGKTYYVTGDTLYNKKIFADLPDRIDVIFLPVNGVGNNMNATDAARFFKASGAKIAVPLHVGMFDENTPDLFEAEPRVLPEIYKEIKL